MTADSQLGVQDQKQHLSTKLACDLLRFLDAHYPTINTEEICRKAGIAKSYLFEEDKWLSITTFKRFVDEILTQTGDREIHFKAGQFAVRNPSSGKTVNFLSKNIFPMRMVYSFLPRFAFFFSRISKTTVLKHANGLLKIRLEPDLESQALSEEERTTLIQFFDLIFYNTLGYYTGVPTNYGYPPAQASFENFRTTENIPYYEIKIEYPKSHFFTKSVLFYAAIVAAFILNVAALIHGLITLFPFLIFSLFLGITFYGIDLTKTKARLRERFEASLSALEAYDQRYSKLHTALTQNEHLLMSYKKFVPFEYLNLLNVDDITTLKRGEAVQVEASLLFCDIRRYTAISEAMSPQETFSFINRYFEAVAPVIKQRGGFIDKYIGDGFLAIFPPDTAQVIPAAIKIQEALTHFNSDPSHSFPEISVGIGIVTGQVVAGTVGIDDHMQVTVTGDAVNSASRVQALTKDFNSAIFVCSHTYRKFYATNQKTPSRYIGEFKLRGKATAVQLFEVFPESTPQSIKAVLNKQLTDSAISLLEQNLVPLAKQLFEEALQKNPGDPLILYYLRKIEEITAKESNVLSLRTRNRESE